MKKILVVLFLAVVTMFTLCFATTEVLAEDVTEVGKVVFHYQLWNNDYSSAGLWTWNNGTGGTSAPVKSDVTDDFGAVYEIKVMSDAADKIGIIPLRKDIDLDTRWNYRETPDGYQIDFDVTALKNGTTNRIDVYYFQGGYRTVHVIDPAKVNVLVAYYDPTGVYGENLGLHAWGWDNTGDVAWGTPLLCLQDGLKSPGDVQGKTALLQSTPGTDSGFIIYEGTDATKKTGDVKEFTTLVAGDVKVIYVTGGKVFREVADGKTPMEQFNDAAFMFAFSPFGIAQSGMTGTYAKSPTVIFSKFTLAVATKKTITYQELVPSGWTLPESLPEFTQYTPSELPEGMSGKVVFHFQKWDGDYTGTGLWTWDCGTNGSANGVAMKGVDSFGAVTELFIASDAADQVGALPVEKNIDITSGDNAWWNFKSASGDIKVDVTPIKTGATTEIHVYYFEGGAQTFTVDPSEMNVFVVYHEPTGVYDANIGLYSWGFHETAGSDWGTLYNGFVDGAHSPSGVQTKVALMTADATATGNGIIVCNGEDGTNKVFNGNIEGFTGAGVNVRYIAYDNVDDSVVAQLYTNRVDFAPKAFVGKYETKTRIEAVDFAPFFVLKQGETIIPIKQIDFNRTADSASEFVLQLDEADKLDNTKEYTLYFDDGAEGDKKQSDSIVLDLDKEAPEISLVDDANKVINVDLGAEWDNLLFPSYGVTDNRDENLKTKVYVAPGKGTLNTNLVGEYPITLQVEDTWGNVGTLTFTIKVVGPESGCNKAASVSAVMSILSLLGVSFFFLRRRQA